MSSGAGHGEGGWDDEGALRDALRRRAQKLGLVLTESDGTRGRRAEYVDAGSGRRVVVAYPPGEKWRSFLVILKADGTRLAWGWTPDLAEVVRATAAWTGGAGLEETRARASFIRFRPWALAHERQPFGAVELAWSLKLDLIHMPPNERHPRAHALLAAAYAQPVLRRLMPVNSHFILWFSTRIKDPYKAPIGYAISPYDEGCYGVRSRGRPVVRTETPQEAVALVVAALPEDLGPAS
ncbi:DUF6193 family natural product biosynthesis protein [Streptomyces sp. NPDC053755]|uniref:DUF6193 family natural product biosynthesis protein n=1 Tax=Streptomyces sp. NPDC053755 TaxID=3155815 RepID=UPI00343D3C74